MTNIQDLAIQAYQAKLDQQKQVEERQKAKELERKKEIFEKFSDRIAKDFGQDVLEFCLEKSLISVVGDFLSIKLDEEHSFCPVLDSISYKWKYYHPHGQYSFFSSRQEFLEHLGEFFADRNPD